MNESSGCKRVVGPFGSQVSRSLLAKLVINEGINWSSACLSRLPHCRSSSVTKWRSGEVSMVHPGNRDGLLWGVRLPRGASYLYIPPMSETRCAQDGPILYCSPTNLQLYEQKCATGDDPV